MNSVFWYQVLTVVLLLAAGYVTMLVTMRWVAADAAQARQSRRLRRELNETLERSSARFRS